MNERVPLKKVFFEHIHGSADKRFTRYEFTVSFRLRFEPSSGFLLIISLEKQFDRILIVLFRQLVDVCSFAAREHLEHLDDLRGFVATVN